MFYYMDMFYWLMLAAILFSMWASARVHSTFRQYSQERTQSGMTGYDAARQVLDANGLNDVRIERVSGSLSDHFDPRTNVIRLSDQVYGVSSTAAVGVAAHEAGHAIQYAKGYVPLKIRNAIIPLTNFGSRMSTPLILMGILFSGLGRYAIFIAYLGVACFAFSVIFQLITLPTEFDASRRAVLAVEQGGLLNPQEVASTKKVLSAAAMTYVAALSVAVTQFLRLLSMVQRSDRR